MYSRIIVSGVRHLMRCTANLLPLDIIMKRFLLKKPHLAALIVTRVA